MARKNENLSPDAPEAQLKQIKADQKQFRKEQKNQKKEARKRAKELENQERELDEQIDGTNASVVIVTIFIIFIWLGILVLLIKMDVGGFGSNVLKPILQDIPVVNKILPSESATETHNQEAYGGYSSLREAVDEIDRLNAQLEQAQNTNKTYSEQIEALSSEVERLKTFEDKQVEFQRILEDFYEEVVYAENGPGAEEYRKYYEEMDPESAQALYKQVVQSTETDKAMESFADTYGNMEAADAAAIFNTMTDDLELVADILKALDKESRGAIMAEMDPAIAARVTRIMNPNS